VKKGKNCGYPSALLVVFFGVVAVSGFLGFVRGYPHNVMSEETGVFGLIYSAGVVASSVGAMVSVKLRWPRSELVLTIVLAALTLLHGIILWAADQTGARLLGSAVGLCVIGFLRWDRGIGRGELERHLRSYRDDRHID